jgi:hypothetical protein
VYIISKIELKTADCNKTVMNNRGFIDPGFWVFKGRTTSSTTTTTSSATVSTSAVPSAAVTVSASSVIATSSGKDEDDDNSAGSAGGTTTEKSILSLGRISPILPYEHQVRQSQYKEKLGEIKTGTVDWRRGYSEESWRQKTED